MSANWIHHLSIVNPYIDGERTTDWSRVTCPSCLSSPTAPRTTNTNKDTKTMSTITFTLTNESITLVTNNGPRTFHKGSPQYTGLREALFNEQWDRVPDLLTVTGSLLNWFRDTRFSIVDGNIFYDGLDVPISVTQRLKTMAAAGNDPTPIIRFYERLVKNPSYRSRTQLHSFMEHVGIPIETDGTFLAYKGVTGDLMDVHTHKFLNAPGQVHQMNRNLVSDDPNVACHAGFHVGALEYARGFGERVVICRVDPGHVVSVPQDESFQKMRVCRYEVIGFWGGEAMPSTTYVTDADAGRSEPEPEVEEDYEEQSESDYYDPQPDSQPDHIEEREPAKVGKTKIKVNKLSRMKPDKLMDQSIEALRRYATHTLKIVGASKLSGGKSALVAAIGKARRKR